MEGFQGVTERFHVRLVSDSEGTEPVVCQVSLDGLFLLSPDGHRTKRKFPLNYISRWALRGSSLVLYTRTPVDVEERTVTLQGDDRVIRSVLDTLTCCCMQMVELLQTSNDSTANDHQVAESLSAMLNGGGSSRRRAHLSADEVEFWRNPEKSGWMYSQGDVIKTWRRRWFVLKQGFLFRFADQNVDHASKPRGIVDLTNVQDVSDGREATSKANSIKLSTATGQVCYLCDSETEQVEWLSALEGTVLRIVRSAAGVDEDAPPAASVSAKPARPARDEKQHNSEWARKLEAGFSSSSARGGGGAADLGSNPMVKVVGFDSAGQGGDYGGTQPSQCNDYSSSGAGYSSIAGYGDVAGAKQTPRQQPLVSVSYGNYPPQASNDSDTSAYASYDPYSSASQQQQQHQQHHQQQQFSSAQPAQTYTQPAAEQSGGGYQAAGQHPNFMDYTPQQSYVASSYQTLPYSSAPALTPPPQVPAPVQSAWQMHHAPDGRPYWANTQSGVTQWEPPAS